MDGFLPDTFSDILPDFQEPATDVLTLPPLERVCLDAEVKQLVEEAFPEAKMKAHRERLCQLLERRSYYSVAHVSQLYRSLVVGNLVLRTEAEKSFEGHRFVRFLQAGSLVHDGSGSKPTAYLTSLAQLLSGHISRKMQATSDPMRALSYQALHKAYFGDERDATVIVSCWFEVCEPQQVRLYCAFPGCSHPHAFSVKMPSKVTFERLFDHVHAVHIPKDVDSKESRKRSAPSAVPSMGTTPDPTQPTLNSFLAKRQASARAPDAASNQAASSSSSSASTTASAPAPPRF